MRRLICLLFCLALMLPCGMARALPELVPQAAEWSLGDAPLRVTLSAQLSAHMPFDDHRCGQLNALLNHVSMTLETQQLQGEGRSSVAIAVDGKEALALTQRETAADTQVQFSFLPEATYMVPAGESSALELLLGAAGDDASLYGLTGGEEAWLDHAYDMFTGACAALADVGKEVDIRTSISGMGVARVKAAYTVGKADAQRMKDALLGACPDGPLRSLLEDMTFSGAQKLYFWLTAEGQVLRIEYAGQIGPDADSLRKVSLVWRLNHAEDGVKDDLVLKTPSVRGNSRNNVVCKRELSLGKDGALVHESEWKYEVVASGSKTVLSGGTALNSRQQDGATLLAGSVSVSRKTPEDDKAIVWTFTPELLIGSDGGVPAMSGTLHVQQTTGSNAMEDALIRIDAGRGEDVTWALRQKTVAVDPADASALEAQRGAIEAAMSTALIRPLVLLPHEDTLFLSDGLPEEVWDSIVEAARQATAKEDVP